MKTRALSPNARQGLCEGAAPWLEFRAAKGYSPKTIKLALFGLGRFEKFLRESNGPTCAIEVQPKHIEAWQQSMVAAQTNWQTMTSALQPVRQYFAWLEETGTIFINPARGIKMPRFVRPLQAVPSEADMLKLIESIPLSSLKGLRDRAVIEIAYSSGLRRSELTHLKRESVDFENRTVRVMGKGGRERVVPLTRAAVDAIHAYRARLDVEFGKDRGSGPYLWMTVGTALPATVSTIDWIIRIRAKQAGLCLSWQSLRRAFATHLLRHGATPYELKILLGHSTFKHLRHYLRHAPEEMIATHRRSRPGQ